MAKKLQFVSKMFLQLFFFFFLLSSTPLSSSQTNEETQTYLDCSPRPFICGGLNINISFPFQIDGRPPSCGHPGYALRCIKNTTLVTTISDREYQVLAIDYANVHIAVADARFIGNSCPVLADNATVDLSLYNYTDLDKAVTLFMNCTFSGGLPPGLHNLSCYAGNSSFYVVGDGSSNGAGESCGSVVQVVMHQAVVDLVMKDEVGLGDALQQGLTLTWTAGDGWCDACVADGGLCGYNSSLVSKKHLHLCWWLVFFSWQRSCHQESFRRYFSILFFNLFS
ncbi:LEAF RUST 10 DISEASE-RESISTANCE LOCUS RECEPTOR-LIKE PROTEIN KINASE-like 2.7 [Dendrobium catenatum]|uniref:LEAF RUST 10 DISEASE-RESISTANCE LOCUS RECEPTOR-LIKE PROTEIN KINASE-like 2.7 n=1 Tax=Dendrobium catenatum TaxID=906689 RepID=UPI0010A04A24|nr:LEAF RUST 10 DISEASE-RESISTANCE LOCUS RECEPTOR-LIKE PROTEIN KINASE-like 2.7 [Dendrobium catenatum]